MLKRIVREAVRAAGYQVSRVPRVPPGAAARPVGELRPFLEDIRWRGFRPKAILDVGANAGEWSRVAKSTFPEAVFTLIEPQVEMKSHLDKFCAETPGSRWINAGAGALVGERSFSVHPNTVSSSFVIPEDGEPTAGTVRIVPIVTLDSVFFEGANQTQPLPQLIKVDVEGLELEVLEGAGRLLQSRALELIMIEASFFASKPTHPTIYDIFVYMAQHDYHAYDFTWFCRRPSDGALGLTEIVFVSKESPLRASIRWD